MPKKEILKKNLINITEGSVSYKRALNRAEKALKQLDAISAGQTIRGKKGEDVVINKEYDKKILDALRHIEDVKRMITDESIEQAVDEKKKKEEEEVTSSNEQSEGHGKMPSEVIPESVVSISEETLKNVIKRVIQERVIKEQEEELETPTPPRIGDIVGDIIRSYQNADVPSQRVTDKTKLRMLDEIYDSSFTKEGKIDEKRYNDAAYHFTKENPGLPILPYETLEVLSKYI